MNSLQRQSGSPAEEQASLWAARLDGGTLSSADRDALDIWLNADSAHRPLLSRYCQFSADLEEQLLALVATGGVTLPAEPAPVLPRRRAPIINWVFGAALAAAAVVMLTVWLGRPEIQNISTAAAQRQSLTLGDGTRVELNARTSLVVELGRNERHVKLSGGEAFFTVSKDPSRPFIIETPGGAVRVTGTVFDVRADVAADLEVTVVEGSVQVRPTGTTAPYALKANDRLVAHAGAVDTTALSASELEDMLAWRNGQIVFHGVSLHDALARFARYHDRNIVLSSVTLAQNKPVGGQFSIDDLDGFLKGLKITHNVRTKHEPNGTIRVELQSEP